MLNMCQCFGAISCFHFQDRSWRWRYLHIPEGHDLIILFCENSGFYLDGL